MQGGTTEHSPILGTPLFSGLESPVVGNKQEQMDNERANITWLGHAMFLLEEGRGVRIVTDPYSERTGYKARSVRADIVTVSHHHHDHDTVSAVDGSPEIVEGIGSVAVKGITIEGIPSFHDEVQGEKRGANTIFRFSIGNLTIVHMGDFGQPITDEQVASLAGINVLMIPIGGTYTIDAGQAAEITKQLKPNIVIPMHYKTKDSTIDVAGPQSFLAAMPIVRQKGSTIEVSVSSLPTSTEAWVMDYVQ